MAARSQIRQQRACVPISSSKAVNSSFVMLCSVMRLFLILCPEDWLVLLTQCLTRFCLLGLLSEAKPFLKVS